MKKIYSNSPWEQKVAYCRALRTGNQVLVSGTVAVNERGEILGHTTYEQAIAIFAKIESALEQLDCKMSDVVRTRTYITDFSHFDDFAKAHKEVFAGIDPVASCVGVNSLIDPKLHLEIEVEASVAD